MRKDVLISRQGTVILCRVAWGWGRITSQAAQLEEAKILWAEKEELPRQVTGEFWRSESTHSGNGGHERQVSFPFAPHPCGRLVTWIPPVSDEQLRYTSLTPIH